ncbi:MAG: DoxX family membrane protein [Candidatus Eremiobacteraeota bacterium]|nr:DoxX family membrane protein [Candidatus Eremiobacteraeota bacterium]
MKLTATIARIVLGVVFCAAGISGFVLVGHPPAPPPGLAGQFQHVFFASRWVLFVDGIEVVGGVLLLVNRYVPLALIALAAVIANIIVFHATMQPAGLPIAAVIAVLWALVAARHRDRFIPLLARK